ncbi:MAG: tetratricopeptide repeat protein [Candidatus Auribacterota bacterium]|jgi:tetratricopeptide (TPR) repeat protein/O-antigen ligase|nr:tetratricopeptide repeat protein [Candidatus Auribacterota bacterium]
MGISNKKLNYIKKFAASKSVKELSADTGLPPVQVERVLKKIGVAVRSGGVLTGNIPAEKLPSTVNDSRNISFFRSAFFICLGTAILLNPLFFLPGLYDMYSLPKMVLLAVLAPLMTVLFLLETIRARTIAFYQCFKFPLMPLFLLVGWMGMSLLWAVNTYAATLNLTIWISALLFCIVPIQMYSGIKNIRILSVLITVAAFCVSAMGIAQFFGLNFDVIYQASVPGSFFGNKNFAAQFVVGAVPFAAYTAYVYRKNLAGPLCAAVFFLLIFFLIVTRKRGAWVASTTALLAGSILLSSYMRCRPSLLHDISRSVIIEKFKRFVLPGLICFTVLMCSVYILPHFGQSGAKIKPMKLDFREELKSIAETEKGSANWRLTAWRNTLLMIAHNPFFGVGLNNWQFNYPLYARKGKIDTDFNEERQAKRVHNDYLQFAAELGIVGLGLFLWFLGSMLHTAWILVFKRDDAEWSFIGITGITAIIAIMMDALFCFPMQEGLPPFFLAIVSSMIVFGYVHQENRQAKVFKKIPLWVTCALFAAVLWFLFTTVWGYRLCKADYFFLEGKRLNKSEMFEQSLRPLRTAVKLNPYNFRIYSLLGRSLNELQQYYESVDVNKRALELHPNYINCMNNLGNALRGVHRIDEAIEMYLHALDLFPDFAEAYNNLGIGYKEKGDNEAARKQYLKAIEIDPNYEKAYNNLANICLAEDRIDEAIEYYKKAIEFNPSLSDVYNNIGLAMLKKGQNEQAIGYFDTCINLNSRLPDPHNNKGTALKNMGRVDEAIVHFKKAITVNSAYLPAYNNLADIYLKQGKIQDAINQYEMMISINSDLRSIYQRIGDLYIQLYQQTKSADYIDKATAFIERGIALYPRSSALYTILGKIYMESDQNQKALETFKYIVELEPNKPESHFNMGVAYHKTGNYREALESYERALRLNPDFIFLYFEMAKIYEYTEVYDKAIENYSVFLEKWKGEEKYSQMAQQKIILLKEKISR